MIHVVLRHNQTFTAHVPPLTRWLQLMQFCQALLTNSKGKDEQVSGFCCLLWTLYHVTYFFSLSNERVMKQEHSLRVQLHVVGMWSERLLFRCVL